MNAKEKDIEQELKIKRKWILISMHDERWDFNFDLSFFDGSVEDFEKYEEVADIFDLSNRTERDGVFIYKTRSTDDIHEEYLMPVAKKLEAVRFECIYLVPIEKMNEKDFLFTDGVVERNKKYGFLDIKIEE